MRIEIVIIVVSDRSVGVNLSVILLQIKFRLKSIYLCFDNLIISLAVVALYGNVLGNAAK